METETGEIPCWIDEPLFNNRSTPIWRYTSLPKFVNILTESALYCQRMDLFDDPYEGQLSQASYEQLERTYETVAKNTELFESNLVLIEELRKTTYLNCWRTDKYEDYGMWHAYTDPSSGLAIHSTVGALIDAIEVDNNFQGQFELKEIDYIDYEEDPQDSVGEGVFFPFRFKRIQHKNEQEVRLMITNYPHDRMHIDESFTAPDEPAAIRKISVDTAHLIEEIRLHPEASSAQRQAVKSLIREFAPDIGADAVKGSKLSDVGS